MRVDRLKAIKATIVVAWACFFAWLLVSGEVYKYIGPRTRWVVWFGAFLLAAAAVGQLSNLKDDRAPTRPSGLQAARLAVLLIPLALLLLVPKPNLGSLAASRKDTGALGAAGSLAPPVLKDGQPVSFAEISYASTSDEYSASIGISDGYRVELTGFVSDTSQQSFSLTRFEMFCCAADVVPYSVTVDPAATTARYEQDAWLSVRGALVDVRGEWIVRATAIKEVSEPADPYI
jgi:uncharacterized repeat protein (TIGR03943 family)